MPASRGRSSTSASDPASRARGDRRQPVARPPTGPRPNLSQCRIASSDIRSSAVGDQVLELVRAQRRLLGVVLWLPSIGWLRTIWGIQLSPLSSSRMPASAGGSATPGISPQSQAHSAPALRSGLP